ncbi:MAG: type IX secretion system membrane protein PorP/SprF [Bacteroidetes bacterium]|nr:type IX secretion system membrane protein PorP/SprF [Bacteroidota bacterium]MBK9798895.1 type IX secretion system membrane protein PorP/SprF [Bacteroidota bacterium]
MRVKLYCFFMCFCCVAKLGIAQQTPQFTQYMFNPLVLNPAYAGSREVISTVLLYRNQWVNFEGAPTTITASINSPLRNKKLGIGLHVISDKIGPCSMNQYVGSFSYRIRLNSGKLAFGLRAGLYDYYYDWSKVDYKDKADIFNSGTSTRLLKPAFDFGMYYYNSSFYAGATIAQLSTKSSSNTTLLTNFTNQLAPHILATVGKAFEVNSMITLRPSAVLRYTNNAPVNLDLNASFLLDEKIWLGIGIRSNKSLVFIGEYNISKLIRVGYSYDLTTQKLGLTNKGSHEFFVGFDIDFFKAKTISPRLFKYN